MINGSIRVITTEVFTPELYIRLVEQNKVTVALNAPHHLSSLAKSTAIQQANMSSVKCQIATGGHTPYQVQQLFNSRLPNGRTVALYGMSEAASGITANLIDKDTAGQLISGFSAKIIDDDGNRLGVGEDGEICMKTTYKFLGYYNNRSATEEAMDEEGFFRTGDIGHFDEDGNLCIVDRKKDLIKYCGFQISPSQVECFLAASPQVKAACVVGIPDDATELPAAFVVRSENSNINEKFVFDRIAGIQ